MSKGTHDYIRSPMPNNYNIIAPTRHLYSTGGVHLEKINVALLGFGTVGKGVYETIQKHQRHLQQVTGRQVTVSVIFIKDRQKHAGYSGDALMTTDIHEVIDNPDIDVVFEAIVGREPAFTYLKQCIQKQKHVITANKEMFAYHGNQLKVLANSHQVSIGFEATTAGGIPIIQTICQLLNANQIHQISAILNGTSNFILTEMRTKGHSFSKALAIAQAAGYAEADPTNDIEGYDALYKAMILSELVFGEQPNERNITRSGIQDITRSDINASSQNGKRWKPIATINKVKNNVQIQIRPTIISETHPLFHVEGVENAILLETDIVGRLTLTGPGAGALPTASAMIEDFCHIFQAKRPPYQAIKTLYAYS